ncbi:hypothetical protein [Cellulomonas timonensis]|uniref:hypothetical protein n=1 Tax=Cellulomonas timonensis TaxID=1689271 RepID=UPI00082E2D7A|nr:hypothetical protein [Cellulomonas timonensis]
MAALLLGAVVGAAGTVMHRSEAPWGMVLALALVLSTGVAVRAWSGWITFIGYAGGLYFIVQLFAQTGPGGDVLVPAGDSLGWWWIIGSGLALAAAAFAPRRLFSDEPRERRVRHGRRGGTGPDAP